MEDAPFRFGTAVGPPWFCGREPELDLLTSRLAAGEHVAVVSPRRYGKTSLVRRALTLLEEVGGCCAYANLLLATDEAELAAAILQAAVRGALAPPGPAPRSLEAVLRQVRVSPTVSFGSDGSLRIAFEAAVLRGSWLAVVEDALTLLQRAGGGRPAVLALDELQVLDALGRRDLGAALWPLADRAIGVSLVLSGSNRAVMERLIEGRGAQERGVGERIALDVVPEEPMVAYLRRRAGVAGKRLELATASSLYAMAEGVPNDVQRLALAALESAGERDAVTAAHATEGFETVVDREAGTFARLFEELGRAPAQQRILKALAERATERVYARTFLDGVGVANANAVTTALHALDARGLVTRSGRAWKVTDPILRRWLTRPR